MRTHGTLLTLVLIAVTVFSLAACAAINETVTGRDIDCTIAPDDVCVRAVDLAEKVMAADLAREFPGREFEIIVRAQDCVTMGMPKRPGGRCWEVSFMASGDGGGMGIYLSELADGRVVTN